MPATRTPGFPPPNGNYMAGLKSFANRGGLVNGLNPAVVGRIWYVNANAITNRALSQGPVGSDTNSGLSPLTPFATVDRAFDFIDSYDIIVIDGVIREQLVTPTGVYNVTIVGGNNSQPRQATSSGVATGGGASWLAPTSPVALTPLLEVKSAGWGFANFQMAGTTSSAAIRLTRSAVTDSIDASHASFVNMLMEGVIGIEDNGGCSHVYAGNSLFRGCSNTAILSLNTAAAIPLSWLIEDSIFQQNLNDIKMSLSYGVIRRNDFMTAGSGATNKVISTTFISVQGGNNHVRLNQFSNTEAQIAPGSGYTGAASDTWMNYVNDQAALAFGLPA